MPVCQDGIHPTPVGFQISSMIPSNREHQRILGGPRDKKVEEDGDGSVPTCNATQCNPTVGTNATKKDNENDRKHEKKRWVT